MCGKNTNASRVVIIIIIIIIKCNVLYRNVVTLFVESILESELNDCF